MLWVICSILASLHSPFPYRSFCYYHIEPLHGSIQGVRLGNPYKIYQKYHKILYKSGCQWLAWFWFLLSFMSINRGINFQLKTFQTKSRTVKFRIRLLFTREPNWRCVRTFEPSQFGIIQRKIFLFKIGKKKSFACVLSQYYLHSLFLSSSSTKIVKWRLTPFIDFLVL